MRSFEERKEEIFRRSEAKIAQRKKNIKRVVATCVPLVLCVTALTGYLTLGGSMEKASAPETNRQDSAMMDAIANGSGIFYDAEGDLQFGFNGAQVPESAPGELNSAPVPESMETSGAGYRLELYRNGKTYSYQEPEILKLFYSALDVKFETSYDAPTSAGLVDNGFDPKKDQLQEGAYAVALVNANGGTIWYELKDKQLTRLADGQIYTLTDEQATVLHKLLEVKWP